MTVTISTMINNTTAMADASPTWRKIKARWTVWMTNVVLPLVPPVMMKGISKTAREPEIAAWVLSNYGIAPSTTLFHAAEHRRHLATPDGVGTGPVGLELAEIKTTSKPWRSIPRSYLRQVWWQQYVLGAERTLLVWEEHKDFVPVNAEPECRWIERDDDQIAILVGYANDLIARLNTMSAR